MNNPAEPSTQINKTFGPYSPIRTVGDLYFVSGQVGVNPLTNTVSTDIAEQTDQVLTNLKNVLEGSGLSLNDVVKTTVFLTDMSDFATVNEIYLNYFNDPRPARSAIGVKELPRLGGDVPIKIEIEAIAAKPGTS